jgi:hypothetical protein
MKVIVLRHLLTMPLPTQLAPVLCEGGGGGGSLSVRIRAAGGGGRGEFPAKQLGQRTYLHFVSFPNWFSFRFLYQKYFHFSCFRRQLPQQFF